MSERMRPASTGCCLAILWLLVAFTSPAVAQTINVAHWPDGSIALNGGWRAHAGDNPAYARPGFDDSQWRAVSLDNQEQAGAGWRWYRMRVRLPAQHPPLALLVFGGDGTYEVYLNGERLSGAKLKRPLLVSYPKERAIPLPPTSGEAEIALRTFVPASSMFLADRGAWRVELGTTAAIEHARRTAESDRLNHAIPAVVINLLLGLAALATLALFWFERKHREYLWLGLYLILRAISTEALGLAEASFLPFSANWFLSAPALYLFMIVLIEFTFCFIGQKSGCAARILCQKEVREG